MAVIGSSSANDCMQGLGLATLDDDSVLVLQKMADVASSDNISLSVAQTDET